MHSEFGGIQRCVSCQSDDIILILSTQILGSVSLMQDRMILRRESWLGSKN